jgi:hypothetical protein
MVIFFLANTGLGNEELGNDIHWVIKTYKSKAYIAYICAVRVSKRPKPHLRR